MRPSRLTPIAVATLAAVAFAACGSSNAKVSAPPTTRARLSLVTAGDEAKAALYPERATRYVLDGSLADLGTNATVRKLIGHAVTEADVARIAGVLGVQGSPTRTDWGYEVRDGDALLNVETGRGATWIDYSSAGNAAVDSVGGSTGSGSSEPSTGAGDDATKPVPPDAPDTPVSEEPPVPVPTIPPPVDVPSADDAANIAQSLLDDLGVLGDQQWAHDVIDTSTDIAVSCAADAPCPLPEPGPVSARTVTFDLVLDGERVPGVGWTVTVGSHRKVEALSGTWAEPASLGRYALRTTAAVFDDLKNDHAQPLGMYAAAEPTRDIAQDPGAVTTLEVRVTGVSLGAMRWDGVENGRPVVYLVPTYRFHAQIEDAAPYDIELIALDPAAFAIAEPTDLEHSGSDGSTGEIAPLPAPVPHATAAGTER